MCDRKNKKLLFIDDGSVSFSNIQKHVDQMACTNIIYVAFRDYLPAVERERLINSSNDVKILDTASLMREIGLDFRTKIVRWLKELPRIPLRDGRSLIHRWMKEGVSLWWYTELSHKNSFARPIYWQLLHLEVIQKIIENHHPQFCYAVCRTDFAWGLYQVCRKNRIAWIGSLPNIRPKRWRFLVQRIWVFINTLAATLLAKLYAQHTSKININRFSARRHRIAAFTWYPRVWGKRYDRWQDMYYEDLPESLEQKSDTGCFFVLRMFDALPSVHPLVYFRRLKRLFFGEAIKKQWAVLECFSSILEVCRKYFDLRDFNRFYKLEKSHQFHKLFVFNGINIYPLVAEDLWRSVLIHWPHMELLSQRVFRILSVIRPQLSLLYCFEYIYGRAIIRGLRKAGDSIIVGMQHGPIAYMKLNYATDSDSVTGKGKQSNPHPDIYLVDGPMAKTILKEGGIPSHCIFPVGPVRFSQLWPRAAQSSEIKRFQQLPVRMLIAPGHSDTEFVLKFAFDALKSTKDLKLIVKLHPKVPQGRFDQVMSQFPNLNGEQIICVDEGTIYDWMDQVDMILATYSSAAIEAIVFGLPVIILESGRTPDQSTFSWNDSPVLRASTPENLKQCINRLKTDKGFRNLYLKNLQREAVLSFGAMDGKEIDRAVDLILKKNIRSSYCRPKTFFKQRGDTIN